MRHGWDELCPAGVDGDAGSIPGPGVPGLTETSLLASTVVSQQHGFVHAGALASIADSGAGYAALTLMPLSPEFSPPSSRATLRRQGSASA